MNDNRPLSPHLTIYRPQITSVLSIMHRGTGIVLSLSVLLLVLWISALSSGPETFAKAQALTGHPFIQLVMFGGVFSFFYHLCNGVRHLFWDMGKGLTIESTYRSGWMVVIASLVLSSSVFAYAILGSAS
ncbi:MAG: succinate dehydrogenase, cytochrome b556 subunit [Pseudomonadota bacterium]